MMLTNTAADIDALSIRNQMKMQNIDIKNYKARLKYVLTASAQMRKTNLVHILL